MSIFLIVLIALLAIGICLFVFLFIIGWENPIAVLLSGVISISSFFVVPAITDEQDRLYVEKYLAQKETIEAIINNISIEGYEMIQLVTKAIELNGEMSERKAKFGLWHVIHYDNTIFDGVELIDLREERTDDDTSKVGK